MRHSIVCLVALGLFACEDKSKTDTTQPETHSATMPSATATTPVTSTSKVPEAKDAMKAADSDMKKVLEQLAALEPKPITGPTPADARKQPTPADAVKKLLEKDKKPLALEMAKVENKKFMGADGKPLDARVYTPKSDSKKPLPVVAYWHGGGFVIADLDTYDGSARAIADEAKAIVVSLDYRHAPEAKFPAAHDDAFAGYQWVLKNAASFGGDPKKIAIAGESAGGNLATNVAIMARDKKVQMPVHEVLVYPVAGNSMSTPSYNDWGNAKPLDKAMMIWFVNQYTSNPTEAKDPRLALVDANLAGLPPTTIINAEIDPLKSDGEMLRDRMKAANVDVSQKTYEGVTHEFFGMGAVVSDAKDAEGWAGSRLKDAFKDEDKAEKKDAGH